MPEIPENKKAIAWLFNDNVIPNYEYKFLDFNPEYNTRNNNKIPVFVLYGKIKTTDKDGKVNEFEGELLTSTWNIQNLEALKKQYGKNTDNWSKDLFFKISIVSNQLLFTPVEVITAI